MNASTFDRILRQILIVPTLAVLFGAIALYLQISSATRTVTMIQGADETIAQTIEIEKLMDDEETGLRGYQNTADPAFLDPYRSALAPLKENFERLRHADPNHVDLQAVDRLQAACERWRLNFAEPLIVRVAAGEQTSDVGLNQQGKQLFDDARRQIAIVGRSAQQRRNDEIARWHLQVRRMTDALLGLGLGIGLTIGLFSRRLLKQVSTSFRKANDVLRLRAEELFHSEEKLRTTLESIGDGVITCDAEGRIDSMNPVAQELTGWKLADARGQPIDQVFRILNEETHQPVEGPFSRVLRLRQTFKLEMQTLLLQRGGTELEIDDSGAPIRDNRGDLIGAVIVFRDVTVARRSQKALLATEKLAVAGRLAASIAHEIHNPLDSVANLLFLMGGESTPEETTHFLELARGEIARVTHISRAMLSLYREAKAPVAVDVKEMLESVLLLLDRRFRDLNVEVETHLPEGLTVQGFPPELRQVFTNLLTNAAEASSPLATRSGAPSGEKPIDQPPAISDWDPPLITLTATPCPAGLDRHGLRRGAGVIVSIADQGPGIPAELHANLFKPFFTTKGERGTGLGLWVSRGIIIKLGGDIDFVTSTDPDHHGTIFKVFMANEPIVGAGTV